MTKRFYFDLVNGSETIRDDEGVDARDLDQAAEEARVVLKAVRDSDELSGDGQGWLLVIRDAAGEAFVRCP